MRIILEFVVLAKSLYQNGQILKPPAVQTVELKKYILKIK